MNNWDYANDIPTSPWRSSMSLPREVTLVETPDGPRLRQQVVTQIDGQLDTDAAETLSDVAVNGETTLGLSGDVAKLDVVLRPGDASKAGITVFSNGATGTRIGYDTELRRLFVDRTNSGNLGFNPSFSSVEDAPLALDEDGTVTVELYLDRASVELFTNDGQLTITDQVFPEAGADLISAWSEGGAATIESITVTPLVPTMWKVPEPAVELSAHSIRAGGVITVSGTEFEPSEELTLELRSDRVKAKSTTADEHGAFSRKVPVPGNTAAGEYVLAVIRADGTEITMPVTVTARGRG